MAIVGDGEVVTNHDVFAEPDRFGDEPIEIRMQFRRAALVLSRPDELQQNHDFRALRNKSIGTTDGLAWY